MQHGGSNQSEGSTPLALAFEDDACGAIDRTGGKGASLSELVKEGLPVPAGFVVTTGAFVSFIQSLDGVAEHLALLDALSATDTPGIRRAAGAFREILKNAPLTNDLEAAIAEAYTAHCAGARVAVRSSATLEDLEEASFAGQHDTYLGVRGELVVDRVRACWVSMFADNAVAYRRRNRLRERDAQMAVVVQKMADADCAGVLFTADPMTGRRDHCAIDANWGLGESVVSGQVNPDHYVVDTESGVVVTATIGKKELAIVPAEGGVETVKLDDDKASKRVLTDAQLLDLAKAGKKMERLKGAPQDIEWCLEGGAIVMLQSRPITSLFPKPRLHHDDGLLRSFMCVGHQQANPAAFSPFMCSLLQWVPPYGRDSLGRSSLITDAGDRAYLDITGALLSFPMRNVLPRVMDEMSPAIARQARIIRDRPDFKRGRGRSRFKPMVFARLHALAFVRVFARMFLQPPERAKGDWDTFIQRYSAGVRDALSRAASDENGDSDAAVVRQVTTTISTFYEDVLPIMAIPILLPGIASVKLLTRLMARRVDGGVVDQLMRGLDGNIVTAMDLMIGDVADLLRQDADALRRAWAIQSDAEAQRFIDEHQSTPFGAAWKDLVDAFGHRAPGEMDIGVPRWSETPHTLLNVVLGKTQAEPGEHRRRHEEGVEVSRAAREKILAAAKGGVFGWPRTRLVKFLARRARAYFAMREHHKYILIVTIALLRKAVLDVGQRGVEAGWLKSPYDIFLLRPEELFNPQEHPRDGLGAKVEERRQNHQRFIDLYPPPILLSTGEIPVATNTIVDAPDGALLGAPVSAGVVTGIARVLRHPNDDVLAPGEILVAPFTDAAWTTLFVHAGGVVLEAGGIMSHGSVIAREYGIPGVAGVPEATRRLKSGQRIRLDGDRGFVEILPDEDDHAS